jgi:hypothetical protein
MAQEIVGVRSWVLGVWGVVPSSGLGWWQRGWIEVPTRVEKLPVKHDLADQTNLKTLVHCPARGTFVEEVYVTQGVEAEET